MKRSRLRRVGKRRLREAEALEVFREEVLRRSGGACARCGRTSRPLDAHHLVARGTNVSWRHDPRNGAALWLGAWGVSRSGGAACLRGLALMEEEGETLVKPYYEHGGITIYHGDALEVLPLLSADVLVTDPPYGIEYRGFGGRARFAEDTRSLARSIEGDSDTSLRDGVLEAWAPRPALVFGSWRRPRPDATRMLLVWDTKGALGMGDVSLPWKPAHQEIYVLGKGFHGHRGSDVLRHAPVQGTAKNGRAHPNEKPLPLLRDLLLKCPEGTILDPFMGSGPTLRAAKDLGRRAIGIEIEERYCEIAAKRLAQEVLPFEGAL